MKQYKCLVGFSEIESAKPDKDVVQFMNGISSTQFDFSVGDIEKRNNLDPALLKAWEASGIVAPYVDKSLDRETISLDIHQAYTSSELKGRVDDLLSNKIIEEINAKTVQTKTKTKTKAKAEIKISDKKDGI